MLRNRVIPALLLRGESLVKTVGFKRYTYVGDPCNTVRIFNELEVDELVFLDITATPEQRGPNLKVLAEIADECFMPLGYGGGIRTVDDARKVFDIGFEKVVINTFAEEQPAFIEELAAAYGNQAVVVSIDVKKSFWGRSQVWTRGGRKNSGRDPVAWAQEVAARGAGEILLTSIDREGSWEGFDLELVRRVTDAVDVPVIAHGGGGTVAHIGAALTQGRASAVALGSMVVFQKQGMGVLVNMPDEEALEAVATDNGAQG